MTYQILTCPNCNGVGCPTCQNTGKVRVDERELQKLKTMLGQMPQARAQSTPVPSEAPIANRSVVGTNLAGIIAFSFLSILAAGAAASWYFLKNLKPFFAGLITLFTLVGTRLAWKSQFFQLSEPDDFLKAIKK
ncbi:MAG: hypothetical protein NTZ93_04225 [Candidatus Beckwithbacteria bacterium]|nr:hypothetical protein [Candidatus Beckwithbacteria bacterium]